MHSQSEAYAQYDADTSTSAPAPEVMAVPVEVSGPVETIERPAMSITTEQITLTAGTVPVRIVGAVHDRESVLIQANGGQVWIGNSSVTTGSGFPLADGAQITLTARCAVFAITSAASVTVSVLGQHRAGSTL